MLLKTFTSTKSPAEAIEKANQEIKDMQNSHYQAKQISQSESAYYNPYAEEVQFHFSLTVLFVKENILNKQ